MPPTTQAEVEEQAIARQRFRRNLTRVMAVQVVALIILWLVQRHFTP